MLSSPQRRGERRDFAEKKSENSAFWKALRASSAFSAPLRWRKTTRPATLLFVRYQKNKRLYFPVLYFSVWLLLAVLAVEAQHVPELSREEKWRGDLMYLFVELPKRHKNLFFKI